MQKLTVLLALLFCVTAAHAAEPSALDLYAAGRYEDAIAAGTAQHSADAYVVAARAALADALMRAMPCLNCFKRVEQFARRAVAENHWRGSDAVERFEHAQSFGGRAFQARPISRQGCISVVCDDSLKGGLSLAPVADLGDHRVGKRTQVPFRIFSLEL